jgi:hypothetical protein
MFKCKAAFLFLLLFTGYSTYAHSQKSIKNKEVVGLFITASDYKKNKLTVSVDKLHRGDQIKLKQFFFSSDIICLKQGKKTVYSKDSIFAIRLSNDENFRFINRNPCLIVDTTYLYIYAYNTVKTEYKQSGPITRRKELLVTNYYFSVSGHEKVYALTLANLRKYALDNNSAHLAVCNAFTTDEMLGQVNDKTGVFKLNEIITNAITR